MLRKNSLNAKVSLFMLLTFAIGMSIFGVIEYQNRTTQMLQDLEGEIHQSYEILPFLIGQDADALGKNLVGIARIEQFLTLLAQQDRTGLEAASKELFEEIKEKYRLTHLYFIKPSGEVLLRAHKPPQYGDVLKRITFLGAQRTQQLFSGLEMGKNFFSLRAVQPVHYQGKAIGYIEVGQEIDHLFAAFRRLTQKNAALFLTQEFIERKNAKIEGMRLEQFSLLEATAPKMIRQVDKNTLSNLLQAGVQAFNTLLVDVQDQKILLGVGPFHDASGAVVGTLLIQQEVTAKHQSMLASLRSNFMVLGAISVLLIVTLLYLLSHLILTPVKLIHENSMRLARGEGTLDSMSSLTRRSDELGKMGLAFENMAQTLAASSWLKTGQSGLTDQLSGDQEVLALAEKTMNHLTPYLEAQVGLFYRVEQPESQDCKLKLLASHAFMHRKGIHHEFALGEGLIGQVALERKTIVITDVPDGYISIQSGSGYATPYNVLAIPCLHEKALKAVLEFGSFQPFSQLQIEFLEQVMPALGIAINTAESRNRMKDLLARSEAQTEILKTQKEQMLTQQEALRESNAKLTVQSEELQAQSEELQTQQEELRQTNDTLEQRTRDLERQQAEVEQKNSALEKARAAIQAKADELELTSKYKSEFLANMSHELRTPLNSLLILSQMLADNKPGNLNDKQIEQAQTIHNAGADLLTLINDILDLSKVEAGKFQLHIEAFPLKKLLDSCHQRFQPIAEGKGLTFKIEVDETAPEAITSDIQRLQQILTNLFSNAFKFTEQGEVKLRIYRPDETEWNGLARNTKNHIAFSVMDTGVGIPADKLQIIFEAFQQADGTTSRKYGGTGLGLSISRQLARLLGGDIQLQSEENQGSTFTLYVPEILDAPHLVAEEDSPIAQADPLPESPEKFEKAQPLITDDREKLQAGDKSILIIDDDPTFAKLLIEIGHEQGYQCLLAANGRDGLEMAEHYKPNGIMLDIGLPLMDGLSVIDRLKQNFATRHIPVHVISGGNYRHQAKQMGAFGYAMKPVDMGQLHSIFDKLRHIVDMEPRSLLLILDSAERKTKITALLNSKDVTMSCVDNADAALRQLQSENHDCAVLDMDAGEALNVLNAFRQHARQINVPIIFYAERELTHEEEKYVHGWQGESVLKAVYSPERLIDEATLFLHQVEADLPADKRDMLHQVNNREAVLHDKKILLVDDDMRNLYALGTMLEEKGMQIFTAEDGQEALEELAANPDINLVLTDIMMPAMDGLETMRRIREQPRFRKLPIIALTAKAMKDDRAKCLEAGANDYLSKPINNEQLLSLLRVWLYR